MTAHPLIQLIGLRKAFGGHVVLDDVSLEVRAGEAVALLGPNGAGKTTLLRILATLLRPSRGVARVAGYDCLRQAERVRAHMGLLAHGAWVYEDLTPFENLKFWATLGGLPHGRDAPRTTPPWAPSRSTTFGGSTSSTRRTGRELRAPHLDRAVEGSPQRTALQGGAERALLLRAAPPLPLPVRARRRARTPHRGPPGSSLARVHPERARRARPGVPGRARARLLGRTAARTRRQVGDLPRQGRRQSVADAARRGDPARSLRRLLQHRPRGPSAPAHRRHRVGHDWFRRRRHALRRDDGARAGPRAALPRPPAAGAGTRAPRRGEGDRGRAAGRATRRGRAL